MSDGNGTKVFNLDSLADPVAGRIEVGGVQHDVLAFDGFDFEWYKKALADELTPMPDVYARIAKIVPTLAVDDGHLKLKKQHCFTLLLLGAQGIDAVEKLIPNGQSPETPPTSPG